MHNTFHDAQLASVSLQNSFPAAYHYYKYTHNSQTNAQITLQRLFNVQEDV